MLYPYEEIYGGPADRARLLALRDALLADGHSAEAVRYFTAPGRTELGGNHTDHQHGLVLAAAVDVDTVAAVAPNGENVIRLRSEGFPACEISLDPARNPPAPKGSALSLLQGRAPAGSTAGILRGRHRFMCRETARILSAPGWRKSSARGPVSAAPCAPWELQRFCFETFDRTRQKQTTFYIKPQKKSKIQEKTGIMSCFYP